MAFRIVLSSWRSDNGTSGSKGIPPRKPFPINWDNPEPDATSALKMLYIVLTVIIHLHQRCTGRGIGGR
jgi:hypothetical protein